MCLKKLNEKFLERNLEFLERQRPSESNIPRSGEVAKAVNCHILFIGHKELDVNEDALFESYNKNTKKLSVRVRAEAGTVYDTPKEVSIKGISSMEITHFYGQYDLNRTDRKNGWFLRVGLNGIPLKSGPITGTKVT